MLVSSSNILHRIFFFGKIQPILDTEKWLWHSEFWDLWQSYHLLSEKCLFSNRCMVWCPTWSKNLGRSLLSIPKRKTIFDRSQRQLTDSFWTTKSKREDIQNEVNSSKLHAFESDTWIVWLDKAFSTLEYCTGILLMEQNLSKSWC